jgi:hypothetical protein
MDSPSGKPTGKPRETASRHARILKLRIIVYPEIAKKVETPSNSTANTELIPGS